MIAIGLFHSHIKVGIIIPEHRTVVTDRLAPACDIHIAAAGTMPVWLSAVDIVLSRALALIIVTADT